MSAGRRWKRQKRGDPSFSALRRSTAPLSVLTHGRPVPGVLCMHVAREATASALVHRRRVVAVQKSHFSPTAVRRPGVCLATFPPGTCNQAHVPGAQFSPHPISSLHGWYTHYSWKRNPPSTWTGVGPLGPRSSPASSLSFWRLRYHLLARTMTMSNTDATRLTMNATVYRGAPK